jgi:hypothetical protein
VAAPERPHEHDWDEIRFRTYTGTGRRTVILRCGCGHAEEHDAPEGGVSPGASGEL